MLIYVKIILKKVFIRTDRQTDTHSTQNYSSEPHKKIMVIDPLHNRYPINGLYLTHRIYLLHSIYLIHVKNPIQYT